MKTTDEDKKQTNPFPSGSPLPNLLVASAVRKKPSQFSEVCHSACPTTSFFKMGMWNPASL